MRQAQTSLVSPVISVACSRAIAAGAGHVVVVSNGAAHCGRRLNGRGCTEGKGSAAAARARVAILGSLLFSLSPEFLCPPCPCAAQQREKGEQRWTADRRAVPARQTAPTPHATMRAAAHKVRTATALRTARPARCSPPRHPRARLTPPPVVCWLVARLGSACWSGPVCG